MNLGQASAVAVLESLPRWLPQLTHVTVDRDSLDILPVEEHERVKASCQIPATYAKH